MPNMQYFGANYSESYKYILGFIIYVSSHTQVNISSNNSSCGEIHSFSHQVSSDTTLFSLQTRLDSFEHFSTSLSCFLVVWDVVVHHRGNIELKLNVIKYKFKCFLIFLIMLYFTDFISIKSLQISNKYHL